MRLARGGGFRQHPVHCRHWLRGPVPSATDGSTALAGVTGATLASLNCLCNKPSRISDGTDSE
ncbi:hypothetical protein HVPorG_03997 [Roseomonas mucosa]|uniref:Uncharacterized protein n=1 Tax=Roseomonas mucosa TaxID=207340 RepID=A0A4Y1MTD4_9PROT|nr:hypothetical protein RADP37_03997 [Roseomonas mucosa]QDD93436.1 hypothetical protein HVIM_03997 [Roseomonas mucosa]QDD98539.1 hypothetical protein ADP8_03997 [Roseomonas mucosa]QDJ08191.1 hypothetical protein HVPorG_03997 [Roseomonas mucosa]UZO90732.1 hypothetical protein RMP42_03997 [Roseomonas mucosa]